VTPIRQEAFGELCPVCGQALPDTMRARALSIIECLRVQPQARMIGEMLADKMPLFVSCDALVELLWGDDPNGGPITAEAAVKVRISHLRRALIGSALRIDTMYRRGWRMVLEDRGDVEAAA
jgi:DNA-binding winged helix-turn-helix (wHTH) protein